MSKQPAKKTVKKTVKKATKKRADKYDTKLSISGTLKEVLIASVPRRKA